MWSGKRSPSVLFLLTAERSPTEVCDNDATYSKAIWTVTLPDSLYGNQISLKVD